jgi:abortive infection bacteriophage resistance protein
MKHINTIFSQLLVAIPKRRFNAVVKCYQGDKRIRNLSCWTQSSVNIMQRRELAELLTNAAPPPKRKPISNPRQLALINA